MANNIETGIIIRAGVDGLSDLNNLIHTIEQAGGDVSQLREQATLLSNAWNTLSTEEQNRQLQELGATANGLARSTNNATASMERLFNTRTDSSINAEINQVNTALTTLRQRLNAGTISQEEFNRLTQAGQTRLNALQAELNQTTTSINRMDNASSQAGGGIDKLTKNLMGMAGAYVGIEAVTSGIHELVETSKQMDSLNQKLEYATGGAVEAGEAFSYVKDISSQLGLNYMDLANGYAQLGGATKNLNMSTEDTRTAFEGVANASAAMSLTADETNGVMLALSQIAGKGKVSMEELRGQLGERLTPAMGIAAKAMGVTTTELEKMVENGINAKDFLPKFGSALTEAFGQQAQNNVNTTTGGINALTNKLTELKTKVLQGFAGDGISSGISLISQGIDGISNAIDNIDPATINAVKEAFSQIFSLIGTLSDMVQESFGELGDLFDAFMGIDDASEKVGFLTRTMQGLTVVIGVVNDMFKGLQIAGEFVFGGITATLGRLYGAMAKLDILPDAMQAQYQRMSDGMIQASDKSFAKMEENINKFESSTIKALDATIVSSEQMAQQAEKASQQAIASFDKMAKSGKASGDELSAGFGEAVNKATAPEAVEKLITHYGELAKQGKITGEQLAEGINLANPKIQELEKSVGRQVLSMAELGKVGADTAQNIKEKMADTATTLGLDFEKASTKISASFEKTALATNDVANNFDDLKKGGYDATLLIEQGLTKMQATAKNKADFDTLNATITKMGQQGKLSAEQVATALEGSKKKAKELEIGVSDVEKAYAKLGIKSQEQLTKQAQETKQAFDVINKDTTASLQIRQQAFDKYAQAQVDANKGVVSSELKTQATALGYANIVAENGRVSVQTADEIAKANSKITQSHSEVESVIDKNTEKLKQQTLAEKQAEAEKAQAQKASTARLLAYTQGIMNWTKQPLQDLEALGVTAEQTKGAYEGLIKSMFPPSRLFADFNEWSVAMADVRRETEKASVEYRKNYEAVNNVTNALGEATANSDTLAQAQHVLEEATKANTFALIKLDEQKLDNLQKAIDDTKHKMDDFTESAKSAADNLEAELARMDGDDSLARKLEQTRKLEDAQNKLNEAKQRGNKAEIEQYERALSLQEKINEKENQQVQQKAEETKRKAEESAQKAQAKSESTSNNPQTPAHASQHIVTTTHADYLAQPIANVTANEVVGELMKKSVEMGKQAMLTQIMQEAKRLPI